jgi:hypothetical protein
MHALRELAMIPTLLASGIILYGIIQLAAASAAVILALRWNKHEFLPGLMFIMLYAIVEVVDLVFFTIINRIYIDVAQFGFILIAIVFFIAGMHPSWSRHFIPAKGGRGTGTRPASKNELFSQLRRL